MLVQSRRASIGLTGLLLVLAIGCAKDVTDYPSLRLVISSEPPLQPGATIATLQLALRSPDGKTFKLPPPGKEADLTFALPAGRNIVTTPYSIDIAQPSSTAGLVQLRVLGLQQKQVLTVWTGVIDTRTTGELALTLRAPQPACDADGDGVADCSKAGCCSDPNVPSDCNDDPTPGKSGIPKGFLCSPFNFEDPCTQCGDGLDEDCDGTDIACVDTDKDGVPDCQETACPAGAASDPTIYPGAAEVCDGKDNDCNLIVDDALPTADDPSPTHKAGDPCGLGACAGGQWQCDPAGVKRPMLCSTAGKKAAKENCDNNIDDDCDGLINQGCALADLDGDGVNNDVEKAKCAFKFAMYHAEFYPPDAPEKCCLFGTVDTTVCDTNCDGKTTPCDATDKDGDGWPAKTDCDDNDPLTYFGAPEKCGDGKVQSCQGSDPPCDASDKDGDGWMPPTDCDDTDKTVNPEGKELCNGKDDNCNGIIDDGNPEGLDTPCGNLSGECGHVGNAYGQATGFSVCKHYKSGQVPDNALDCAAGFDSKSGTCVGCDGDQRPKAELCNGLDDDCNGKTDEPFSYTQEDGTKQAMGASCDGIGACGIGFVECSNAKAAACSSDANGSAPQSAPETCNDLDDNCNGQTDENLAVLADSTCQKLGVCASGLTQIQTVCAAGVWICDYSQVPGVEISSEAKSVCKPGDALCTCSLSSQVCHKMMETSCDGLDNDCDGKTDEDFDYTDYDGITLRKLGDACLTGACAGGTVLCAGDQKGLTCSTLGNIKAEQCNQIDDNCNGITDEASDLPVEKSTCKQVGVCAAQKPVATCSGGNWLCDYSAIANWQSPVELTCDGLDNNCNGVTDDGCDDDGDKFCDGAMTVVDTPAVCPGGKGDCNDNNPAIHPSAIEVCDDIDNDCNGTTDDGCNGDSDGFCNAAMTTVGKPQTCLGGGGDCNDGNPAIHPGAIEACDGIDNDCDGVTDNDCDGDGDGYCTAMRNTVGKPAICPSGGGDCNDADNSVHPNASETCNGVDDNCNGMTDEGVQTTFFLDGDGDGFGASDATTLACSKPPGYAAVNGDCNDSNASIHPGATETCNGVDDNCNGATDEGVKTTFYLDADQDGFGLAGATTEACSKPAGYAAVANDCDDSNADIHPGATEACNGYDDNCDGVTDGQDSQGCAGYFGDGDGDGYGPIGGATVCLCSGTPQHPVKIGGDCDDNNPAIHPAAVEICNGVDDNCNGTTDENVGVGDACAITNTFGSCTGVDVCDGAAGLSCNASTPATETCNGVDDDCDGVTDQGNPGGGVNCGTGKLGVCEPGTTICANGGILCSQNVQPSDEICNGIDDNCDGVVDEGNPGGGDACSTGLFGVCAAGTLTCFGGSDTCTQLVLPSPEICGNSLDENCDGATDEGCP